MTYANINIASRKSILALWQSEYIKKQLQKLHPSLQIDIIKSSTKGDVILDTPLALIGGKGLFTKEIEDLMLDNRAQIAVHSLKDMPTTRYDGLVLAAISKREDPKDAFLSCKYKDLDDLPQNATIGTTSLRRGMQLKIYRPDLIIHSLRGNVQSRISKLKNNDFDAIILAYAGVKRLNLLQEVKYISTIPTDILIPAMGQGALGIEARDEEGLLRLLEPINDKDTYIHTHIERSFVHTLNGGCQAPIGVYAYNKYDKIYIDAIVGIIDGSDYIKDTMIIQKDEYQNAGVLFANTFIKKGALELIKKSEALFQSTMAK
jgi:hydroxymethylbilane synthase